MIFKLAQIGFLAVAAILLSLLVWKYPLIVAVVAVVMVLLLASAIKSGGSI